MGDAAAEVSEEDALMMFIKKLSALGLAAALFTACQPPVDETPPPDQTDDGEIDQALLATYKQALPKRSVLLAPRSPAAAMQANTGLVLGQVADYPVAAHPVVEGVNAHITGIIDILEFVTSLPPTLYNSETLEFVWGPYDDEESAEDGDKVLAYVKDNGDAGDHRFTYALLRGVGNDTSTYVPVILGGANPDADTEDHGNGVTLWDLEANRAFMDANYPDHGVLPTGRLAAAYSKDQGEDGNVLTIVLAALRGFTNEEGAVNDLDHLWGHVDDADAPEVAFVHINTHGDFIDTTAAIEDLSLRVAFVEDLGGRGEAIVTGGDLHSDTNGDSVAAGVECFDGAVARTYFDVGVTDAAANTTTFANEGALDACGVFVPTLDALGVPSLDSIDQGWMQALDEVATNGLPEA
jgi:hypothetical protein